MDESRCPADRLLIELPEELTRAPLTLIDLEGCLRTKAGLLVEDFEAVEIKLDDFARPTRGEDCDLIGIAWGIVPVGHRRCEGPVRIDWDLLLPLMTAVGILD